MTSTPRVPPHRGGPVVDLHVHGPDFLPQPFRRLYRSTRPGRPRPDGFGVLHRAGVDVAVANAVGDPIVTRWYLRRDPWQAVDEQLARIERGANDAGVGIATSRAELDRAIADRRPAVVLGVEGADALGDDLDRVDRWHQRGVRMVVPVHLTDNRVGTTCLPWQHYTGPVPVRRPADPGLSPFGHEVIRRFQRAGILVDVSHADDRTLHDIVSVAEAPVVASHTGARTRRDFARFLDDDGLRAVASTGGVIGLWPYRGVGKGVRDMDDLMGHARHIAEIVGPEHLCLGTDMNGVPRHMAGYRGERDFPTIADALVEAGFTADEVAGIVGENALRVLSTVMT